MSLKEQLKADMKEAMKAREAGKVALAVIRMVNGAIKNTEINEKRELSDTDILGILAKEMKMRQDSLAEFEKGQRDDLVAQTKEEMEILKKYLPAQLSENEIRTIVVNAIGSLTAPVKMGDVMGKVMPETKGRADGKLVNTIVREEIAKVNG
ncbi:MULTISPECIES: GatB/YqeY domain-containing protein [unclassified Veillonella]|uniref:GatB/YqeY domain-containing protein n=1 Tax=unclassified Veillonella TaxID=2630086 RepID=UPI001389B71F|nr:MULTISPECIES: GatB/YqeY domain-containing protein [unclassified Veillonella]KAF1681965.1 aspartyl-tRNA amidotransferase [Veillonella sp. R32]